MSEPTEDRMPRIQANRAGLKAIVATMSVIALGLLAALLAEGGLFTSDPGAPNHPDGLTTLALVLAVLAFLVQILVFIFQTQSAGNTERRAERVNMNTRSSLEKIEASNKTTQTVLLSQFERLLNYVIDERQSVTVDPRIESEDDEQSEQVDPSEPSDVDQPVTKADLRQILDRVAASPERPVFRAAGEGPSEEDKRIFQYFRSWPDREEAEAAVSVLESLSPFALATFARIAALEVRQRSEGQRVGLRRRKKEGAPSRPVKLLIERGLARVDQDGMRVQLTEHGRDVARMLPLEKDISSVPDWIEEVREPLLRSP